MKGSAHPPGVNGGQTEARKHVLTPLVCLQPNDIWLQTDRLTHCENLPTVIVHVWKEARGSWDSQMSQMKH